MNDLQGTINYTELFKLFDDAFLHDDKVQTYKTVREFHDGKDFAGDYFHSLVYEPVVGSAPRFYSVGGPFDLISKKAPETAQIFQNGQLIANIEDYTSYVKVRTGAMDPYVLRLLKASVVGKKVLYVGAGEVAQCSLQVLKYAEPKLAQVDYFAHTKKESFEDLAGNVGVKAVYKKQPDISEYDFIFMHTNTSQPILTDSDIARIKQGAVITTFISSTEHGEVADDFYKSEANVIVDLEENIQYLSDIKRVIKSNKLNLLSIKKLLQGEKIDNSKSYTVFRSGGTALQDFTMCKLLMNANSSKAGNI